jgi:hypothetical protein
LARDDRPQALGFLLQRLVRAKRGGDGRKGRALDRELAHLLVIDKDGGVFERLGEFTLLGVDGGEAGERALGDGLRGEGWRRGGHWGRVVPRDGCTWA